MSALYPTLEDMKVDQIVRAQQAQNSSGSHSSQQQQLAYPPASGSGSASSSLYPTLNEYMGLALQPYIEQGYQVTGPNAVARISGNGNLQIAPVTGQDIGLQRADIKSGIREVFVCKDENGKIGLRVRHFNKGVFVAFVHAKSPCAMGGMRFGDQILQINGENVAGWDTDKVHNFIKKAAPQKISFAVRDRPFERIITMHKDSAGHIGFLFKNGCITAIVKDSSAARNGVLIEHQLIEVGGQNVVGLKDKEIGEIIKSTASPVTITIMPSFMYEHIVKCMGSNLITKKMDHSIPDL